MGLLGRKKEKKSWGIDISGRELAVILNAAIELAKEEVNGGHYLFGPEVLFDYGENSYLTGVKYDKKQAKRSGTQGFCQEYCQIYLNKQVFRNPEELLALAEVDGTSLRAIESGIIVGEEFRALLGRC